MKDIYFFLNMILLYLICNYSKTIIEGFVNNQSHLQNLHGKLQNNPDQVWDWYELSANPTASPTP